jgi:flagellar biosynthesis protein FlhG
MMRVADQAEGLRLIQGGRAYAPGRQGRAEQRTRVIAVTSGKGGVGKTQVSANLGVSLAQSGKKVLLLDADLGLASLDLALGVRPSSDLLTVIRGEQEIEDVICEGPAGVHLLPACPGRYEMANLGPRERSLLSNAVDEIASRYDVLIIDTGAGIGSTTVSFAGGADEVLLVVTPEPTSLRDAYAMAKVLHRRFGLERIGVIANAVHSELEGNGVFENIDAIVKRFLTLELRYLGAIPRDPSVQRGCATGLPFVIGTPNGSATRALGAILQRLHTDRGPGGGPRRVAS